MGASTGQELTLLYVHGERIGYGRTGVKIAEELAGRGVDVYDHLDAPDDGLGYNQKLLERPRDVQVPVVGDATRVDPRRAKRTNVVCWVSVPTHARGWWTGQHTAMFTMWEAMTLPESFRETLHEFDTVIVPSQHNVELFSHYHPNVKRVLLGVDPSEWHWIPREPPGQFFNFLISGSGKRKGTDLAQKAFRKVFGKAGSWGSGPIPRLTMKNLKGETYHGDRIEMITSLLSPAEEQALYAQAHCYLQPSRGEGFGLQPLQAMAQGCPTILTNAHGHEAFADLGIPLSWKYEKSSYFIYGDAGDWWEPSFDELCESMRDVYDNWEKHLGRATESTKVIADQFTWEKTTNQFLDALGVEMGKPFTGTDNWVRPEVKKFLVRVNKEWCSDVGSRRYYFKPGNDYYEIADVKRVLFEAGLLDPSCVQQIMEGNNDEQFQADLGLTDSQLERVPHYKAENSHCPTCGQMFNSGTSRADVIYEELQANAKELEANASG